MTETPAITIELTGAQIRRVIHEAGTGSSVADLLRGWADDATLASRYEALSNDARMARSLLLGLLVLTAFPTDGRSLSVKDVATKASMSPSTTHRYVTTLQAAGLLEQDPKTRRYKLPIADAAD